MSASDHVLGCGTLSSTIFVQGRTKCKKRRCIVHSMLWMKDFHYEEINTRLNQAAGYVDSQVTNDAIAID
jgi:hypothetical protein